MLFSALILGFFGSLHCLGMCGPIALMLPVGQTKGVQKVVLIGIYHLGRILAYALIGLVFGLLGKGIALFGYQQQLSIATGVFMILIVLVPSIKHLKLFSGSFMVRFIGKIKSSLGNSLKKQSKDTLLTIGFLNGFLPCGLVYMALVGALAAADASLSSLYMVLFGVGTIPMLTVAIYSKGLLQQSAIVRLRKFIPVFIVLLGLLFILRGLGLGIPFLSPPDAKGKIAANVECNDLTLNRHGE